MKKRMKEYQWVCSGNLEELEYLISSSERKSADCILEAE